ncbi:hypothetical protein DFH09DRAFT_1098781 [Mycena vulgaris]|nr:hypothetical protein DFH09DRAFT_1098781 [Mycena vulgaris]
MHRSAGFQDEYRGSPDEYTVSQRSNETRLAAHIPLSSGAGYLLSIYGVDQTSVRVQDGKDLTPLQEEGIQDIYKGQLKAVQKRKFVGDVELVLNIGEITHMRTFSLERVKRPQYTNTPLVALREITDREQTEMVGAVGLPVGPDVELPADMIPRHIHGMWVSLQRMDKTSGKGNQKFYSRRSTFYDIRDHWDFICGGSMYWVICVEMGIDPPPALFSGRLRFRVLLITGAVQRGCKPHLFCVYDRGRRQSPLALSCSMELYRMQNTGRFTLANTNYGKGFVETRDRIENIVTHFDFRHGELDGIIQKSWFTKSTDPTRHPEEAGLFLRGCLYDCHEMHMEPGPSFQVLGSRGGPYKKGESIGVFVMSTEFLHWPLVTPPPSLARVAFLRLIVFVQGHGRRQRHGYYASVTGLEAIHSQENEKGLCVRLCCPLDTTCSAEANQIKVLHEIISVEEELEGGMLLERWFGSAFNTRVETKRKYFLAPRHATITGDLQHPS